MRSSSQKRPRFTPTPVPYKAPIHVGSPDGPCPPFTGLEPLEPRVLLTAVVTQSPTDLQLAAGAAPTVVDLNEIFTDDQTDGTVVRFDTNVGQFDMGLYDQQTPLTVANFLNYVTDGDYANTIIHRSIPGFVIQGGGFSASIPPQDVPADGPVQNEPGISNIRGRVAMAKLGGDPNSATNEWFVNLDNNSGVGANPDGSDDDNGLDFQNGGFTAFGEVLDMTTVDQIAAVTTFNAGNVFGSPFTNLPLINFDNTGPVAVENLVTVNSITVQEDATFSPRLIYTATSTDINAVVPQIGEDGTLTLSFPAGFGQATVTVTALSVDGQTVEESFDVTVNDPPTISTIGPQAVDEDQTLDSIAFTVGDSSTDAGDLTVTATSSDQAIIPNANLQLANNGANRTLTLTPAANTSGGPVTITLTVDDGIAPVQTTFEVTVNAVNDPPAITPIADQEVDEDQALDSITITLTDIDSPADSLSVIAATSSDQAILPDANLVLDATGSTLTLTPAADATGTVTITLTASDGLTTATSTFDLTINPINDAPTVSTISGPRTIEEDGLPLGPLAFTVGDVDTDLGSLTVTATSSNESIIPNSGENLILGGAGSDRTIQVTPLANAHGGPVTITLTVSDGLVTAQSTFEVSVTAVNDDPIAQDDEEAVSQGSQDNTLLVLDNDSSDPEPGETLTITAVNDISGGGTVTVAPDGLSLSYSPAAGFEGQETFTYTISDGNGGSATATVTVTVAPLPDLLVEIDEVQLPQSAKQGQRIDNLPIMVTNQGSVGSSGRGAIELYASADEAFDAGGDLLLARLEDQGLGIGAGKTKTFKVDFDIPQTAPLGDFHLIARVDADDDIVEGTESNNTVASTATFAITEPQTDLTVSLNGLESATLVPGNKVTIPVTVINSGTERVSEKITLRLLVSADDALDPTDLEVASTEKKFTLNSNQQKDDKLRFTVPDSLLNGSYKLIAQVDATAVVAEIDEANNAVASGVDFEITKRFGVIDGKRVKLTVNDVTYGLSGDGLAQFDDAGNLALTGTDAAKSSVTVNAKKDADASINNLTIDGSIKAIKAKQVAVNGDITITGTVTQIDLLVLDEDHLITIGGTVDDKPVNIKIKEVVDTRIDSQTPIRSLSVDSWLDGGDGDDLIEAPWIGSVTSKGAFEADLTVTDTTQKNALGKMNIKGDVQGIDIISDGPIGNLNFAGGLSNSTITVNDTGDKAVARISVKGDADAVTITSNGRIANASFSGGLVNSTITANNTSDKALGKVSVKGDAEGVEITSDGSIAGISFSGGLVNSTITASDTGDKALGKVSVKGDAEGVEITSDGSIAGISFSGGLVNSTITANNTGDKALGKVSVKGDAEGVQIASDGAIAGVNFSGGLVNSTIAANDTSDKALGKVSVKGDANAVTITSSGRITGVNFSGGLVNSTITASDAGDKALGKVSVKGDAEGVEIISDGSIAGVSFSGKLTNSTITASDTGDKALGKVSVKGDAEGVEIISDGSIAGISFSGGLVNSAITTTATGDKALGKVSVKDEADNLTIRSGGSINGLTFGRLVDSTVLAGIDGAVLGLPTAEGDFINQEAVIKSFKTKGIKDQPADFINSNIAAWEIGSISVKVAQLDNGGAPFGFAASEIKSVSGSDGQERLRITNLDDPNDLTDFLFNANVDLVDLQISLF